MAAVKPGFRPAMTWLHDWSGLVIGWLLFAIVLAGTLAVFRPEIGDWARPEAARTAQVDSARASAAAVRWLSIHAADAPAWFLQPADDRATTTLATWGDGKGGYVQRWLDARDGSPEGIRDTRGGEFFYRLHFELQLPYPWGRILSASAVMLMLLAILTGIVAHRRFFADFFTFRARKGQRSWLDAHNLLAVTALPFHLMISFTGALTLANLIMPWGQLAGYDGDSAAVYRDLYPAAVQRAATGRHAPLAPIAPMLREAERRFGGGIALVSVLNPGDAASVVTVTSAEDSRIGIQRAAISFDGPSGRILAAPEEHRPALRTFNFLYALHTARFAQWLTRWAYFVCGLMMTAMIGAGLILWTVKRRARRRGFGFALVERLNIGFIAGTPIAFAAFFLANRLLPIEITGRAELEVRIVFWAWGLALLFGALRPAARAWRELLSLACLTCLAIPIADLLTGAARADTISFGVDGTALALAAGFGAATALLARWKSFPVPLDSPRQAVAA
ncbi:MAG TPA: PepSY-associated TM helix domain-containing protein [Sphingomonas sp.]|nr:PepSY-associated TM helix domain-containing protein [Sphingomonas sp.]